MRPCVVPRLAALTVGALLSCTGLGGLSGGGGTDEAGTPPDAADSPSSADDGVEAGTWCSAQVPSPSFCSDFDELPFAAECRELSATGGGLVAPDSVHARSAPSCL